MTKLPTSQPLLRDAEKPVRSRANPKKKQIAARAPFDPMPDRVEPALALLKQNLPIGDKWGSAIKWDGYRLAIHSDAAGARILSRGGYDWALRFPAIEQAARELGPASLIIDGEAVVLDDQGRFDLKEPGCVWFSKRKVGCGQRDTIRIRSVVPRRPRLARAASSESASHAGRDVVWF